MPTKDRKAKNDAVKRWRRANPEKYQAQARRIAVRVRAKLRDETISAYGGVCVACGDDRPLALELDHIDEIPPEHRSPSGKRLDNYTIFRRLRDAGYPPIMQVLCGSCHNIKTRGGDPYAARSSASTG
jgi:hypothetical protein